MVYVTSRVLGTLIFFISINTSMQHFIMPPSECFLADICNHTWIPNCGKDELNMDTKQFDDDCTRHEYNCDNQKDYAKVEMSECDMSTTEAATSVTTTTTTEATTTTTELTTTTTEPTTTTTEPTTTTTEPTTTTTELTTTSTKPITTTTTEPTTTTLSTTSTTKFTTSTTTTISSEVTSISPAHHNCSRSPPTIIYGNCSSSTAYPSTSKITEEQTTSTTKTTTNIITTTEQTTVSSNTSTMPTITMTATTTITQTKDIPVVNEGENTIPQKEETTKFTPNVSCNYDKGCDRPISWETTAKGETRDFYQILRDRYGDRVKLLRATTHWPRRAGWTKNYKHSFVFGRHIDSPRKH